MHQVTPKELLLDLLRVSPRPIAVRNLLAVGERFGFESNAMRVALSRLVSRGLIAADDSDYHLAPAADVMTSLVDGWRLGDRRVRTWKGDWLCMWHPRGRGRKNRGHSHRALHRLGFREGRGGPFGSGQTTCARLVTTSRATLPS